MLGHASAAKTLDVYADLFDEDLDGVSQPSIRHGPQRLCDFCAIFRPTRYRGLSRIVPTQGLELLSGPRRLGLAGRNPHEYGVLRSRERATISRSRHVCAVFV